MWAAAEGNACLEISVTPIFWVHGGRTISPRPTFRYEGSWTEFEAPFKIYDDRHRDDNFAKVITLWMIKRGSGRTEEMVGFSLLSRDVAQPPWVRRRDLLIHVDRVEDWTPLSLCSSSSPQSDVPSSGSDGDARPFPVIYLGPWTMKIEDGQERECRTVPVVPSLGCHGMSFGGSRRNHDRDERGTVILEGHVVGQGACQPRQVQAEARCWTAAASP